MTSSRLEKLEKEQNPYPRNFPDRTNISYILERFSNGMNPVKSGEWETHVELEDSSKRKLYNIAGRIIGRRDHGYNIFFDIFDQSGEVQLHVKWEKGSGEIDDNWREGVTNKVWKLAVECDIGDMVGVSGHIAPNPRGEPLFIVSNWVTLAKALREPPDKRNGLRNPEMKYRHRELDLLSSKETRDLFKTRANLIFNIRKYLNERDYVEIEAPVLQPIYGGATARPFVTRHNTLDQDYYLGISSELYIKRALVGGFDRVYSFTRCFRNEGISTTHNPEFTNLEIFETCKTAKDMEKFTDELLEYSAHSIGSLLPPMKFDRDLLSSGWPLSRSYGDMMDFPKEDYAEAWELYIYDMEIASGASDLNDPREQAARLKGSEKDANIPRLILPDTEIPEHDPYDQNYIEALEQGALPWAGVGIGIDRLMMILTGKKNIRDVMMFPTLKDK